MVYIVGLVGLLHDKLVARAGVLSHEIAHHLFGLQRIVDKDPLQATALGLHRRLLELVRTHLPKSLEACDGILANLASEFFYDRLLLLIGPGPVLLSPVINPVERGHPQVDEALLDQFGKVPVEEGQQQGHDVMAIDIDPDKVQSMVGQVTYPVTTDASSEISLRELGVQDFDVGVVALADVEVSIMVSVLFKTLNINNIIARASSDLHKDTLIRLGCDRVVFAEDEMGEQLANTIFSPNVTEYLELTPNMGISKLSIPKRIVGMSLSEAGFINQPGNQKLTIISIKRGDNIILYPSNQEILNEGDEISIIGNNSNINKLIL